METKIQFINAVRNDALEDYLDDKLSSLSRKYDKIQKAEIHFKCEKHPREENYVCEITLDIPGKVIFSSANEVNFNKAINVSTHQLSAQLEKIKTKHASH
jgi:ribosomal subunit interface protein